MLFYCEQEETKHEGMNIFIQFFYFIYIIALLSKIIVFVLEKCGKNFRGGWLRNFRHAGLEGQDDPVV